MADESTVECPQCGHINEPAAKRCVNCGLDLEWALENWDKCVSGPAESYPPLVLLSDDEVGALTLIGIMMERAGYRVAKSHDAYETLDLTEHFVPDLIITDISKPGINGIEMTSILKSDPDLRGIPVLVLSARSSRFNEAMEAGAIRCLSKPILHKDLTVVAASILAGEVRGKTTPDEPEIECPQCGHFNRHSAETCIYCHIDLEWARERGNQYWSEPAETRRPLIMLSDDKTNLFRSYCKRLESNGYRIAVASYTFSTIRLAERLQPDLIITNFMYGIEMVSRIRSNPAQRDIPAILVTESDDFWTFNKALNEGVTRLLLEPVSLNYNMMATIASVLAGEFFPLSMIQIPWHVGRKFNYPNYTHYQMCRVVSQNGFNVWPLWYREDPVRMAKLFRPAVITLAYHLCEADGLEQLTRFKADPQVGSTPVVMWFKEPAPELEQRAMQYGAQAVYTGPPDGKALAEIFRSVLGEI